MLRLMGLPQVEGVAAPLPDKAFALMALLLLDHPMGLPRSEAASLLWEEAAQDKAFASLRQLLALIAKWENAARLRLIDHDGRAIRFAAPPPASDIAAFLASPRPDDDAGVKAMMDLAQGRLLSGLEIREPELARWLEDRRADLRTRLVERMLDAAGAAALPELEFALGQLGRADPADERILRARMHNLIGLGRDREALLLFKRHADYLRAELGSVPELASMDLAAKIGSPVSAALVPLVGPDEDIPPSHSIPRVVLLPPAEASWADAEVRALARSLATDLTLQLCRRREFAMLAPHTARQVAGPDAAIERAPFQTDYLVTTSIFPGTRAARLAFGLIDLKTRAILHADEVPLEAEHLLASQQLIAHRLSTAIAGHVAMLEERRYRATGSASAYVRYLLGANMVQNSDLGLLRGARRHFSQALRLVPDYVPALAGLARSLNIEWLILGRTEKDLLREAQMLAFRSVDLDPLNPVGHRELGHANLYLGALDESEKHFADAIARAPHHADLLIDHADVLVHSSRARQAKPLVDQALALNPLAPDDYRWVGGSVEFFLENYEAAVQLLLGMDDQAMVDRLIAAAAAMAGDMETATRHKDRWMERYPEFRLADFGAFMPHRSKADVEHFKGALAKAGFI